MASSIEAVVFDLDGVLIPPWRFRGLLRDRFAIPPERTAAFFRGDFVKCVLGESDLREVLPLHLEEWGWPGTLDALLEAWFEIENAPDPGVLAAAAAIRAAGLPCYVASTQERYRARYVERDMGFGELFDGLHFSCDLGCKKPDSEFFERVAGELGKGASELLFFDDTPGNVARAAELGWNAEVFVDYAGLRRALLTHLKLELPPAMTVGLRPVAPGDEAALVALEVAPDQVDWVAANSVSLAQARANSRCAPLGILAADSLVGFAMYEDYGEDIFALHRLMVDQSEQRRGYGREAVRQLVEHLRERGAVTLYLSFRADNTPAQAFYEQMGFRHHLDEPDGERVYRLGPPRDLPAPQV